MKLNFESMAGACGFHFTHNNNKVITLMFETLDHANLAFNKINSLDPLDVTTCLDDKNNVSLYFHNGGSIVYGFMHGFTTVYVQGIENVYTSTCFILLGYFDQDGIPRPTTHGAILSSKYEHLKLEDFALLKS